MSTGHAPHTLTKTCRCCGKPMTDCLAHQRKNDMRNLVWDAIRERAYTDPEFKRGVEPIGVFTFMRVVDGVVDSIYSAHDEACDAAAPVLGSTEAEQ